MVNLLRTDSADPRFIKLVLLLEKELHSRYGAVQEMYEPYNKVGYITTVVLALIDGEVAGCGAIKKYADGVAEIKRMYVEQSDRGKGVAKAILDELERWALELGYSSLILETGLKQPESLRLYENNGYKRIPNYEPYMNMVESICYEKQLLPSS